MDRAQDVLFGQAPRRVGTPNQHWVFAPDQVEFFVDSVNGRRNAYGTLGWWDFSEGPVSDKVLYDLDSTAKDEEGDWRIFEDEPPDDEVVSIMRNDPEVAEKILGDVCEDAQKLARRSRKDNVPVVGVFSGFGIHIHQLFEPMIDPAVAMSTTAYRYIDHLTLQTPDPKILGQPERICRIPNCERIAGSIVDGDYGPKITDGRGCGLYTIPLTVDDLATIDPQWLLEHSTEPRAIEVPDDDERGEMRVWHDYETGHEEESEVPPRPLNPGETEISEDDDLRALLMDLCRMPCMVERLLDDPNPDHDVRVNATIMLLNVGLSPQTIVDLYSRIGWVDFDRKMTRKQVLSIYRGTYSDRSCRSLRQQGLCTRSEDPEACDCYGWSNGDCEWKA